MTKMVEKIERYLLGEMSDEERMAFEEQMDTDTDLRDSVIRQANIIETIREIGGERDEAVMAAMKHISPEELKQIIQPTTHAKRLRFKTRYVVAAAALVVFVLFSVRIFYDSYRINRIYEMYYTEYTSENYRGEYNDNRFSDAMSYWAKGRDAEVLSWLKSIVAEGDAHPQYQDACWYLGLLYLKIGDAKKAREMFTEILAEQGFYADKAAEILKEL